MADSNGAAPAAGANDAPALPAGMMSTPKVVSVSNKKQSKWDLEADVVDEPIEQRPAYTDDDEGKPVSKPKQMAEPASKKAAKPVEPEEDDEEENESEDESENEDEDDAPVKPRKKRAIDFTTDDEEDEDETSDNQDETAESTAKETEKADPKDLEKKYKVSVKDGDKTVEKDYSLKQLLDMAQKNETGDLKLYQASEAYKKVENVVERLKTEPFEVLKYIAEQTGQDYYQLIEKEMADQFKLKVMTPEDRQAYLQAEQDKRDLTRFRTEQAEIQKKLEAENLTKQQTTIANNFVKSVGDAIEADPYLKHVYDNLDEGDDKNYIIKKFGSWIQQGIMMKQIPQGQPNHLPANFDLSPTNPKIMELVVNEIKKEQEAAIKAAPKAAKLLKRDETPEEVVNRAGTKVREKVPGVKNKSGNSKPTNKQKAAKRQSTYDFLREIRGE